MKPTALLGLTVAPLFFLDSPWPWVLVPAGVAVVFGVLWLRADSRQRLERTNQTFEALRDVDRLRTDEELEREASHG